MNQLFTRQDIHHTSDELAEVVPGLDNQVTLQGDGDEERERARLAALWLTAGLKAFAMSVDPIGWHVWGLQADVTVNGMCIGDLLTVYTRFRQDDFLMWLRTRLAEAIMHAWRELQSVPSYAQRCQRAAQQTAAQEE